jgi:hypothetical protein
MRAGTIRGNNVVESTSLAGSDLCIQSISFAPRLERFFSFVPLSALGYIPPPPLLEFSL